MSNGLVCVSRGVEWDPLQPRLALCTGTNKLYMWSPTGSLAVEVPVEGESTSGHLAGLYYQAHSHWKISQNFQIFALCSVSSNLWIKNYQKHYINKAPPPKKKAKKTNNNKKRKKLSLTFSCSGLDTEDTMNCLFSLILGVFNVHSLKWHPEGNTILLLGKDQMCVCYLSDPGAEKS